MNHTIEPQARNRASQLPVERLQHYDPEVHQRVQQWFASGQPLVWIPIFSQQELPRRPAAGLAVCRPIPGGDALAHPTPGGLARFA